MRRKGNLKRCPTCKEIKELSYFSLNRTSNDGYSYDCKACARIANRIWIEKHFKKVTKRYKDYKAKHREQAHSNMRNQRLRYPEKFTSRDKFYYAIKTGKLKKQPCSICGEIKAQAHHPDYKKPYDVMWLCVQHHHSIHRLQRLEVKI